MSYDLAEILDQAVTRLRDGEERESVLAAFPSHAPALAPLLESAAAFAYLQPVTLPHRTELAADRRVFLEQAAQWRRQVELRNRAVSASPLARLKAWTLERLRWPLTARTEENRRMYALLAKVLVIAALGLGAAGGTVAAAAGSLPDSALYPLKIGIEEARLSLANDPAAEAELAMSFVQERVREMKELALKGEVPDEPLMTRFHLQLQTSLQQAAQVDDDDALNGLLQRTRQQLRAQENELAQTQAQMREQVREQAREQLRLAEQALAQARAEVEAGLAEPALYRWRHTDARPEDAPEQPEVLPPPDVRYEEPQQGPAGDAPGPQVGPDGAPVRNQQDYGPSDNRPEDLDAPLREREENGPPADAPAGPGTPAQNQQQNGAPASEPAKKQNQQRSPSSELLPPALSAVRTQEQAGPLAAPPYDYGLQSMLQLQAGPPDEYPEPAFTQTMEQNGSLPEAGEE